MANLSPKPGSDLPTPPNQQPNLARRQPDFARSQPNFSRRQPNFAYSQPNVPLNQPNFAQRQPSFAHSQPNFPYNQPYLAHRQPSFAHGQPNFPYNQSNFPSSPNFLHGQQQHFSPADEPALPGHPYPFLDQSRFSIPGQLHFPNSTNSSFTASSYQSFSPSSHQRFFAQGSRPAAHSNHPDFSNQQQQQRSCSRTSSQESLPICNLSPSMQIPPPFLQAAAANRRVTFSTSAADAARRHEAMQPNFAPANDGPSSFIGAREIHNAIRQVHETLIVVRNEMVAMYEKVDQNIYDLHRETLAMHERNNGSIDRVIKMLNYSERNNLARTVNSTITSQSQLLEPLLTCDGVRPEDFPVDTTALNNLDIHQVTALCELYSLGLSGGMEQKMQRLRMFIGIERA